MELDIRIKMNEKLFLRNPEDSVLGKKILLMSDNIDNFALNQPIRKKRIDIINLFLTSSAASSARRFVESCLSTVFEYREKFTL